MKTTHFCVLLALAAMLLTSPAGAALYFGDDFNSYTTEAQFLAAVGSVTMRMDIKPSRLRPVLAATKSTIRRRRIQRRLAPPTGW